LNQATEVRPLLPELRNAEVGMMNYAAGIHHSSFNNHHFHCGVV
jgi:hypothetical protein